MKPLHFCLGAEDLNRMHLCLLQWHSPRLRSSPRRNLPLDILQGVPKPDHRKAGFFLFFSLVIVNLLTLKLNPYIYIYISFCTRDTGVNCLPLAVNRSIDPRPPRCKVAKPHRGDCKAFTEWPLGLSHLSHRDNLTSCQPKCQQPRCKPARSLRHIALNQLIPCAR